MRFIIKCVLPLVAPFPSSIGAPCDSDIPLSLVSVVVLCESISSLFCSKYL